MSSESSWFVNILFSVRRELYAAAQGRQTIVTGVAGSLAAGLVGMGFLLSRRLRTVRQ